MSSFKQIIHEYVTHYEKGRAMAIDDVGSYEEDPVEFVRPHFDTVEEAQAWMEGYGRQLDAEAGWVDATDATDSVDKLSQVLRQATAVAQQQSAQYQAQAKTLNSLVTWTSASSGPNSNMRLTYGGNTTPTP